MARKKTALGVCAKAASKRGHTGAAFKKFVKACVRKVSASGGLGYVPPRGGSPQYTWKRKRR